MPFKPLVLAGFLWLDSGGERELCCLATARWRSKSTFPIWPLLTLRGKAPHYREHEELHVCLPIGLLLIIIWQEGVGVPHYCSPCSLLWYCVGWWPCHWASSDTTVAGRQRGTILLYGESKSIGWLSTWWSLMTLWVGGMAYYKLEVIKVHYPTQFSTITLAGVHGGWGASLKTGEGGSPESPLSFCWHCWG